MTKHQVLGFDPLPSTVPIRFVFEVTNEVVLAGIEDFEAIILPPTFMELSREKLEWQTPPKYFPD
ncbi:hypothetical protein AXF42_Ash013518 [Apostasia shenzhenica]|uniref:Uncharacterized protein n=1 Tax=Apostasia shenzhenica TaxID=1088818 RepID=A0A2I0A4G0_9ASPA|nr:hypothetical protein AXF42_Ash013518 [Apostasia shenzhenica]